MSNRILPAVVVVGCLLLAGCGSPPWEDDPWEGTQLDENGWQACHQFGIAAGRIGGQATAHLPPGPERDPLTSATITGPGMDSTAPGVSDAVSSLVDSSQQPTEEWAQAVGQMARICLDRGYKTQE